MRHRAWLFLTSVALGACLVALGLASTAASANSTAHPIKVGRCDLEVRGGRAGGYSSTTGFVGYASGYTPGAPYWFNDPMGHAYYQPPTSGGANLFIDFTNVSGKEMKVIEWGAGVHGVLVAEARDVGTFSPNAEIKRKYGVEPNIVPKEGVKLNCLPLKIEFSDGTTWSDKEPPPAASTLYQGHP